MNADPLTLINSDCLAALRAMPAESVQCCVTSPPYFGLRDYGHEGQIGLEETPADYIAKMVEVFAEVRRVLKPDGTLWLNLGDSYANDSKWGGSTGGKHAAGLHGESGVGRGKKNTGLKAKNLMMIPERTALALQADGWYLRSKIPWIKRNCMPESMKDRPTSAIEYVFLFSKSESCYYDHEAVKMPVAESSVARLSQDIDGQTGTTRANGGAKTNGNLKAVCSTKNEASGLRRYEGFNARWDAKEAASPVLARARRNSDWFFESWQGLMHDEDGEPLALVVNPQPFRDAHFAVWPPRLVYPMVLASTRNGDVVLEPFGGSGTTGMVALELGHRALLIELNPDYCDLIRQRCAITPGLALSA